MPKAAPKKKLKAFHGKTGYAAPAPAGKNEFKDVHIAVLTTRWNVDIVDGLREGTRHCLKEWGVPAAQVQEFFAPGAFELPLAATVLMKSGRYDGVVVLGAVIRGDTPHFEFVAGECARGLREASQKRRVPLGFGVLTVNTPEQAQVRAAGGRANKGYEAAAAMLEMIRLLRAVSSGKDGGGPVDG